MYLCGETLEQHKQVNHPQNQQSLLDGYRNVELSELWCELSRCCPIEIVIWMTILKLFFSNMWQELRTKQQLGYIVQLSLGHGYCLNMPNSTQQNIESRQTQEAHDSLKGSNRSNHTVAPPKSWSKLHRFAVFSSHEQSNTATLSSRLKSGFLLKLRNLHRGTKDELGREALSDTSSLSPAPSDGRQQTRIDTGSLYAAEWKISQRWDSKTWFFFHTGTGRYLQTYNAYYT